MFFGDFQDLCKGREPLQGTSIWRWPCHMQLTQPPQQGKLLLRCHLISPDFLLPLSSQFLLPLNTNTPQKSLNFHPQQLSTSAQGFQGSPCALSQAQPTVTSPSTILPNPPPTSLSSARLPRSQLQLLVRPFLLPLLSKPSHHPHTDPAHVCP